jgi:hypothetical protein
VNELNVKVAKALGYRVESIGEVKTAVGFDFDEQLMRTVDADGNVIHEAWYDPEQENFFAYVINHLREIRKLPDWQRDANAAFSLPLPEGFSIERMGDYWWGKIPLPGDNRYSVNGDNPAEIVCKCFVELSIWQAQETTK